MNRLAAWLCVLGAGFGVGCADAKIRKVPKRSDYSTWTDEDQRRVDSMCGLRFYRARPYVTVYRPFPLESSVFLVDGVVSADGKWVQLLPSAEAKPYVDSLLHWGVAVPSSGVPASTVVRSKDAAVAAGGLHAQGAGPDSGAGAGATIDPGTLDKLAPHAKAEDRPSGTSTLRLSTAIDAVGVTKLRDYFDLVYLPDFEEEYVVDPRANLGEANVSLTQGPGGVLLAMGMQVDNSALTRPIVDAFDELAKQGTAIAKNALGKAAGLSAQGAAAGAEFAADQRGTLVTLKVHVVKMADPGLYPILKDSEMLESRHCAREFGICHCGQCVKALGAAETHVVPVYPYSRVAYQFHRTVVVEHLIDASTSPRAMALGAQGARAPEPAAADTDAALVSALNTVLRGDTSGCIGDVVVVGVLRNPIGAARGKVESLVVQVAGPDGGHLPAAQSDACRSAVQSALWAAHADLGLTGLASPDRLSVVAK